MGLVFRRRFGYRPVWVLLTALAAAAWQPVLADTVYLTNGRSFEDVVAEVGEQEVTIHLSFGTLRLPSSRIDRVVDGSSSVAEYRQRLEDLRRSAEVDAASWLDLSLWARTEGLDHGVREAALTAAELDPDLPGLDPLMRSLGFVLDPDLGRWIPFDELMRRQGFVLEDGLWISRDELIERRRIAEARLDRDRERRAAERSAAQQAELALLSQQLLLATTAAISQPPVYAGYGSWGWGAIARPPIWGPWRPPHVQPHPASGHAAHYRAAQRAAIIRSQPGSLLPIAPRANHAGFVSTGSGGN